MSHSAYAPPSADLRTGVDELGNGEFDFGRCMSDAWDNTWANLGLWLGVGLVGGMAMMLAIITILPAIFVVPVLVWGFTQFYLRMHDRSAEFADLFAGFSCYGRALGGMILFSLAWCTIWLPGQVIAQIGAQTENAAVSLIGLILNLATIGILPRLVFTPLLMVDRGLSCPDALTRSWQVTSKVKWKMIGLMFLQSLVMMAGIVVFIVGIIPASVMSYLLIISAYRQVVGGPITTPDRA